MRVITIAILCIYICMYNNDNMKCIKLSCHLFRPCIFPGTIDL